MPVRILLSLFEFLLTIGLAICVVYVNYRLAIRSKHFGRIPVTTMSSLCSSCGWCASLAFPGVGASVLASAVPVVPPSAVPESSVTG